MQGVSRTLAADQFEVRGRHQPGRVHDSESGPDDQRPVGIDRQRIAEGHIERIGGELVGAGRVGERDLVIDRVVCVQSGSVAGHEALGDGNLRLDDRDVGSGGSQWISLSLEREGNVVVNLIVGVRGGRIDNHAV